MTGIGEVFLCSVQKLGTRKGGFWQAGAQLHLECENQCTFLSHGHGHSERPDIFTYIILRIYTYV